MSKKEKRKSAEFLPLHQPYQAREEVSGMLLSIALHATKHDSTGEITDELEQRPLSY